MLLATGSRSDLTHCAALGRRRPGACCQRLQECNRIGDQRVRRRVVAADLARIVVHMDQRLARMRRLRQRVALRGRLAEARADRKDQIGAQVAVDGGLGHLEAQMADVVRMRVGKVVLPLEGQRYRQLMCFRRGLQRLPSARRADPAAAGYQQRPIRLGETGQDCIEILSRWESGVWHRKRLDHAGVDAVLEHVLGQHHHDRPWRGRLRLDEGAGDDLAGARRVVDDIDALRHVAEHLGVVHLLERPPADLGARHLPDEQHQRHRILLGDVHGNRGVGGARSAADEGDARPTGQLGIADRRESRSALMPADDRLDGVAVVQGVERGQVAFTRHAEHPVDAVRGQAIDEKISGTTRHRLVSPFRSSPNAAASVPSE